MKNALKFTAVLVSCLLAFPAHSKMKSSTDYLSAPEELSCEINESNVFEISWLKVDGATKYALELNCNSEYGNLSIDPENPTSCEDVNCKNTFTSDDIADALEESSNSGDLTLPEADEFSIHLSCSVKVKGLNPPRKRQNHPASEAPCNEKQKPADCRTCNR